MMNFEQSKTQLPNLQNENYADLFHKLFEKRQTPQGATSKYHNRSHSLAKSIFLS